MTDLPTSARAKSRSKTPPAPSAKPPRARKTAQTTPPSPPPEPPPEAKAQPGPAPAGDFIDAFGLLSGEQRAAIEAMSANLARAAMTAQGAIDRKSVV